MNSFHVCSTDRPEAGTRRARASYHALCALIVCGILEARSKWIIRHVRFHFLARFREAPLGWTGWDGIRGRQFILPLHHYIHLGKQTAWRESGAHIRTTSSLTCTQTRTWVRDETDSLIRMHVQYVWSASFEWDAEMNFCSKDERKEKETNLASLWRQTDKICLPYKPYKGGSLHAMFL